MKTSATWKNAMTPLLTQCSHCVKFIEPLHSSFRILDGASNIIKRTCCSRGYYFQQSSSHEPKISASL